MKTMKDEFPELTFELSKSLRDTRRESIAQQIENGIISRVTFDEDANAAYIYLEPSRELNIVERNTIGIRHGETVPVGSSYWTAIDIDNFDRIRGIEMLNPGKLKAKLRELA